MLSYAEKKVIKIQGGPFNSAKQNEAAALDNLRVEETAYQCYFQPDSLPSPMESGVILHIAAGKIECVSES